MYIHRCVGNGSMNEAVTFHIILFIFLSLRWFPHQSHGGLCDASAISFPVFRKRNRCCSSRSHLSKATLLIQSSIAKTVRSKSCQNVLNLTRKQPERYQEADFSLRYLLVTDTLHWYKLSLVVWWHKVVWQWHYLLCCIFIFKLLFSLIVCCSSAKIFNIGHNF